MGWYDAFFLLLSCFLCVYTYCGLDFLDSLGFSSLLCGQPCTTLLTQQGDKEALEHPHNDENCT